MTTYPRDLVGYGQFPPNPKWENTARIAVQFVINYEEGGESCILHGDEASERYLTEVVGTQPIKGMRDMNVESHYEYGSRVGFWRLYRMFTSRRIPVTVYGVTMALERNPAAVAAMIEADWEIATHGYRWINYQFVSEEMERDHIQRAIALHTQVTGHPPQGWYTGKVSPNTRRLILEEGEFLYDSDSYCDDLPYWDFTPGRPHLIIPYTLDNNDMKFGGYQGFNCGEQFLTYLKDAFDVLYAEGDETPKLMNVGLHCRLSGKPGRAAAVARFLDYVKSHDAVWLCRRIDIAKHWYQHHYPDSEQA